MSPCKRSFIALIILLTAALTACTARHTPAACPGFKELTSRAETPERITTRGQWTLLLFVTDRGTRSQGIHGELYYNGEEVKGEPGESLETPLGTMKYHGSELQRTHIWGVSGWVEANQPDLLAPHRDPETNEPKHPTAIGVG